MKRKTILIPTVLWWIALAAAQNTVPGENDYCSLSGTSIAITGNKAYIYGGWQTWGNGTSPDDSMLDYQGPNDYVRTIDLSKSFNTSNAITKYVQKTQLPDKVPRMTHAAWWPVNSTHLELMLGVQETSQHQVDTDTGSARLLANEKWTYSISDSSWDMSSTKLTNWELGPGKIAKLSPDSVSHSWIPTLKTGYYLGGWQSQNGVTISSTEPKGNGTHNGLLTYSYEDSTWTNSTAAWPSEVDSPLTHIHTDTDEALVIFGGKGNSGTRSMGTIKVYSTHNKKWYTYTVPSGNSMPNPRSSFCSALMSAPDGSSHAILVFGGVSTSTAEDVDATVTPDSSIWALTIPAMVWVPLSTSSTSTDVHTPDSKVDSTCAVLPGGYVMIYGGRSEKRDNGPTITCDDDGKNVYLFNVNKLQWTDRYIPGGAYKVPAAIRAVAGDGGATVTKPDGGWAGSGLAGILQFSSSSGSDSGSSNSGSGGSGDSAETKTSVGGIVGGVVGGLAILAAIGGGFFFWRRRKQRVPQAEAEGAGVGWGLELEGSDPLKRPVEMRADGGAVEAWGSQANEIPVEMMGSVPGALKSPGLAQEGVGMGVADEERRGSKGSSWSSRSDERKNEVKYMHK